MVDLNSLKIFAKIVEAGSFSEAARRLKMPLSTVSRRLSELEDQLNLRLLERSTRKLRLTDVGSEVLVLVRGERAVAEDRGQDEPRARGTCETDHGRRSYRGSLQHRPTSTRSLPQSGICVPCTRWCRKQSTRRESREGRKTVCAQCDRAALHISNKDARPRFNIRHSSETTRGMLSHYLRN